MSSLGPLSGSTKGVAVIIPARNEERRIAATVDGARQILGVELVVVVDDGSTDRTDERARAAGARVVHHRRNRGKAAAMTTGARSVAMIEARDMRPSRRHLLFLDADLEATAEKAAPLIDPVEAGEADMSIAILPKQLAPGGGRGLVVNLARDGIERATGWTPTQPLSGQRCLTRQAFEAALPLAKGFGVEVGMTIDLLRKGFRLTEVEVDLHHRVTGKDWRAQIHRGRQWRDVARALATRKVLPRPWARTPASPDSRS
jgi:glycosyltransferase involved in cell wall biosynthesis